MRVRPAVSFSVQLELNIFMDAFRISYAYYLGVAAFNGRMGAIEIMLCL